MPKNNSEEPVEIEVEVHNYTADAVLVDDGSVRVWLPLQRVRSFKDADCEMFLQLHRVARDEMPYLCRIVVPENLAYDKGLI